MPFSPKARIALVVFWSSPAALSLGLDYYRQLHFTFDDSWLRAPWILLGEGFLLYLVAHWVKPLVEVVFPSVNDFVIFKERFPIFIGIDSPAWGANTL